eukprot:1159516-Pelagomonas_calceolata.AAC.14
MAWGNVGIAGAKGPAPGILNKTWQDSLYVANNLLRGARKGRVLSRAGLLVPVLPSVVSSWVLAIHEHSMCKAGSGYTINGVPLLVMVNLVVALRSPLSDRPLEKFMAFAIAHGWHVIAGENLAAPVIGNPGMLLPIYAGGLPQFLGLMSLGGGPAICTEGACCIFVEALCVVRFP